MISITTILLFNNCAHTNGDRNLNEKLSNETEIRNSDDLKKDVHLVIYSSEHLTNEQKLQLSKIKVKSLEKMDKLREQSYLIKGALLKDIVNDTFTSAEQKRLRERLEEIEKARLNVFFDALNQSNKLLGRHNPDKERVMENLWMNFRP